MPSNLMPEYVNTYWLVTQPFPVYALVGHTESNTYVGRSQMLGNVYERTYATPGDEIHALVGGIFLVKADGTVHEVKIALSDKHPFEKVYLPREDEWPLDHLVQVPLRERRGPYRAAQASFNREQLADLNALPYGRGIDYVYEIPE